MTCARVAAIDGLRFRPESQSPKIDIATLCRSDADTGAQSPNGKRLR